MVHEVIERLLEDLVELLCLSLHLSIVHHVHNVSEDATYALVVIVLTISEIQVDNLTLKAGSREHKGLLLLLVGA